MSWNDERTQRLLDISMVPNEVGLECSCIMEPHWHGPSPPFASVALVPAETSTQTHDMICDELLCS